MFSFSGLTETTAASTTTVFIFFANKLKLRKVLTRKIAEILSDASAKPVWLAIIIITHFALKK